MKIKYIHMNSIVIKPKDQKELKFMVDLLRKLGVESKVLSDEEKEDIGLSLMMKDVDRQDKVSESEIRNKLKHS